MTEPSERPGGWDERSLELADRFIELADTMADDFAVPRLMDRLVHSCVELVDAKAAGVLLGDSEGMLQLTASNSEESRVVKLFELQGEQGPCFEAVAAGRAVAVDELCEARERWPQFAKAADSLAFGSAYAFPLRLREHVVGGLNLLYSAPGVLAAPDRRVAQALADMATIGLLDHETRQRATRVAEQLQGALNSRVVIEQAKGILAEHAHIDMQSAFEAIRKYSRDHNARLSEVAGAVVRRDLSPDSVLASRRT